MSFLSYSSEHVCWGKFKGPQPLILLVLLQDIRGELNLYLFINYTGGDRWLHSGCTPLTDIYE